MSASSNLSSQQLAMFMTAKEIKEGVNASFDRGGRNLDELWSNKLRESKSGAIRNARYVPTRKRKGNTLYESIQEHGVREPVELMHRKHPIERNHPGEDIPPGMHLAEGHHRVAAAYDIDPNMLIPVIHEKW